MLKIVDKISINAHQARFILEKETERGGVFIDLDRCIDYQAHYIELVKPLLQYWRDLSGRRFLHPDKKEDVRDTLINTFGIDHTRFIVMGNRYSIAEEVLEKIMDEGDISKEAMEFIKVYKQLTKWLHKISYLEQYMACPLVPSLSFEGHRMLIAKPTWTVLSTSRISAKQPSVQNMMHEFADIITYPKGWLLVRTDSGQIEPRITWSYYLKDPVLKKLIELHNDAYLGQLQFITMPEQELKAAYLNPNTLLRKELSAEDRKTLKRLGLAGTYGGALAGEDPRLANGYRRMIVNHPARKVLDESVREAVRNGADTFYGAFGSPVVPESTSKYKKGTDSWIEHLIRCGINNPIQTTASELMCESVYQAKQILDKQGHPLSWIGYYKHDEGLFYLQEKDHHLAEQLIESTSYDVTLNGERWIPIYSEGFIGKKEGEVEEGCEPVPVI